MVDLGVVAQWGGLGVVALGLGYSFWRNGKRNTQITTRHAAVTDGKIDALQENINNEDYGLSALKKEINKIEMNCALKTQGFENRLDSAEKAIDSAEKAIDSAEKAINKKKRGG